VADDDEDTEIKFSVFSPSGELVCLGINTGAMALFDYAIEPSHTLRVSMILIFYTNIDSGLSH